MYCTKLTIPKVSGNYKLYIYRSKSADDIDTIAEIRTIQPIIIIDEAAAQTEMVNGKECYVVYDDLNGDNDTLPGVEYLGPVPNLVPVTEYETEVDVIKKTNYTYVNYLKIKPLPTNYKGTMLYYSVIGVDEDNGLITHLSKVGGVLISSDYQEEGTRHIYSCDNYTGQSTDTWNYVSSMEWGEDIIIGDINNPALIERLGNPFVETVPVFEGSEVNAATKGVGSRNFMVLEIPNIWQQNNKTYNYRKLKSFKIQNVSNEQYGNFSIPTFQSLLPVSMERMVILKKADQDNPDVPIALTDTEAERYDIIRKDGIYYNAKDHRKLGLNKYNIPLEEKVAIFSESSVQDQIKIQVEALPNHEYSFTIYLFDVYGHCSEPICFTVTT